QGNQCGRQDDKTHVQRTSEKCQLSPSIGPQGERKVPRVHSLYPRESADAREKAVARGSGRREPVQWPTSMKTWRWLWPVSKILLAAAILFFVGREFYLHLQEIDWASIRVHPAWLILAGLLYLADWSLAACFWGWLLRTVGERPRPLGVLRAYFVGQ